MKIMCIIPLVLTLLTTGCVTTSSNKNINIPDHINEKGLTFFEEDSESAQLSMFGFETKEELNIETKDYSGFKVFNATTFESFFESLDLKEAKKILELNFRSQHGVEALSANQNNVSYIQSIESIKDNELGTETIDVKTDVVTFGHSLTYTVEKLEEGKKLTINFYSSELKQMRVVDIDKTNYIEVPEIKEYSFDSSLIYKNEVYLVFFDVEDSIDGDSITSRFFDTTVTKTKIYIIKVK